MTFNQPKTIDELKSQITQLMFGLTRNNSKRNENIQKNTEIAHLLCSLAELTQTSGYATSNNFLKIKNDIDNKNLKIGKWYLLSDYRTVHLIPFTSVLNINNNEQIEVNNEPLLLQAISTDSFAKEAISLLYPQDTIHYTINSDWWGNLKSDQSKGAITYRHIPTQPSNSTRGYSNVKCNYDFVNVFMRRWAKDNSNLHNVPDAYVLWDTSVTCGSNGIARTTFVAKSPTDFKDVKTFNNTSKEGTVWSTADITIGETIWWQNGFRANPLPNIVFNQYAKDIRILACQNITIDAPVNHLYTVNRAFNTIFNRNSSNFDIRITGTDVAINQCFFTFPPLISGFLSNTTLETSPNSSKNLYTPALEFSNLTLCNFKVNLIAGNNIEGFVKGCKTVYGEIAGQQYLYFINIDQLEPNTHNYNGADAPINLNIQLDKKINYIKGVFSSLETNVDYANISNSYLQTNTPHTASIPITLNGTINITNAGTGNTINRLLKHGTMNHPIYIRPTTAASNLIIAPNNVDYGFIGVSRTITAASGDAVKLEWINQMKRWKIT